MPKQLFGISYSQKQELLLILVQLICYINQYYVVVFLLGPLPFWTILLLTFANSRAIIALYASNSIHKSAKPEEQRVQYCKRCKDWIQDRDHHCIFTGRCVQKSNYPYFVSYLIYSYLLSTILTGTVLSQYTLLLHIDQLETHYALAIVLGLASGFFFLVFTAALLSGVFRSIFLGIYTVDELKGKRMPQFSNKDIRMMWFSAQGRKKLWQDFRKNWQQMVGPDASLLNILLVS